MQCTSNTCKHFERFNFCSQASTVAWRGWRIAHLALPYLFTFTASPESHRLMYGSVPDCQWNQWPVSNISLSEMASARASAQLWWWWWWVISLVSPLVSSLVGGAVYANVIWPGMKWKYAYRCGTQRCSNAHYRYLLQVYFRYSFQFTVIFCFT